MYIIMKTKPWNNYWKRYSRIDYKKILFFVIIIALVAAFISYYGEYKPPLQPTNIPGVTPQQPQVNPVTEPVQPTPKGGLIIAVKDATQKLKTVGLGEATELFITVKSVQVDTQIDPIDNRSVLVSGWTTLFDGDKGFDLLRFTDNSGLLAEKEVDAGNYSQIRIYISGANIKINNAEFQIFNKTYPMYLPTEVFKMTTPFSVEDGKTTVLTLDFDVPSLVSRTSQGYTLGPPFKELTTEITVTEKMIPRGSLPENVVEIQ